MIEEVQVVKRYLLKHQSDRFEKGDAADELLFKYPVDAVIMSSIVKDSFFLTNGEEGTLEELHPDLSRGLASPWVADYMRTRHGVSEGAKRLRFIHHQVPMKGYSGKGAERAAKGRLAEMYDTLVKESEDRGYRGSDALFVPYYFYSDEVGEQFSEEVYHYLVGSVLADLGFIVFDRYAPSIATGSGLTPDLSAFRTRKIETALRKMGGRGLLGRGGFLQELQLPKVAREAKTGTSQSSIEAESLAVEIKRSSSQYNVTSGEAQLRRYLYEADGFYEEGYLAGPSIEGERTISFTHNGDPVVQDAKRKFPGSGPASQRKIEAQWEDVELCLKLEVLKNLQLQRILQLGGEARTYLGLIDSFRRMPLDSILDRIEA